MILLLSQFSFGQFVMAMLLTMASIFMILLILVQQGRGGGLTGALGGMGGQSAFGTKAGDLFTRITIVTAVIWILLSILTITFFNRPMDSSAAPPTDFGVETESPTDQPADENQAPSDPVQAESEKGLDENTKLNPPADAVPKESKPSDAGKEPDKNGAAPSANPAPNQPAPSNPDTEKPKSESGEKTDSAADDKPPSGGGSN